MFVDVHQDYDGNFGSALSYKYRVTVWRDRYGKLVCDSLMYTNEYPKAEAYYTIWTKNMKQQPTLIRVLFHEHYTTDEPVLVMSSIRAETIQLTKDSLG